MFYIFIEKGVESRLPDKIVLYLQFFRLQFGISTIFKDFSPEKFLKTRTITIYKFHIANIIFINYTVSTESRVGLSYFFISRGEVGESKNI